MGSFRAYNTLALAHDRGRAFAALTQPAVEGLAAGGEGFFAVLAGLGEVARGQGPRPGGVVVETLNARGQRARVARGDDTFGRQEFGYSADARSSPAAGPLGAREGRIGRRDRAGGARRLRRRCYLGTRRGLRCPGGGPWFRARDAFRRRRRRSARCRVGGLASPQAKRRCLGTTLRAGCRGPCRNGPTSRQ